LSGTDITVDIPATDSVASQPVAPPNQAGETQGSTPAPVDTTVPSEPTPAQAEQSPRRDRAFATLRRENKELHRQFGYMQAQMEALRGSVTQQAPADGDQPPQQRQTRSPSPAAEEAYDEHNRSVLDSIADRGEEYEEAVDKIASDGFPMTKAMRDFLVTSDKAAELAKLLADNPKEAMQISLLGDRAADRAMERLEARASAKPAPKTTKAPPPVPTVGGRSTPEFDPKTADMDDYAPHWHARRAKRS
jgi:hypothetical protein